MPEMTIREVHGEEVRDIFYFLMMYAFTPTPPMQDKDVWWARVSTRTTSRYWVLFEDEKPVAGTAHTPMPQNVRGKIAQMGGVWWVAVHPEARRKGYARRLLVEQFAQMRAEGYGFSGLYPFRESFYERLGFVTFPQVHVVSFNAAALSPVLTMWLPGDVTLMPIEDGRELYLAYLRKYQRATHGMAINAERIAVAQDSWLAVARVAGEVVGIMLYRMAGEIANLTMTANRFYYDHPLAKYLLLEWIARHIDHAGVVELHLPQGAMAETWLSDMDVQVKASSFVSHQQITAMGRVLDVAAMDGMQTGSGRFTAQIKDPSCPWNEGIYRFETTDGLLQVTPADQADCELTIQALSALVYGTHDPGDFVFRGWGDPSPAVQSQMRRVFPRMIPYLHELF